MKKVKYTVCFIDSQPDISFEKVFSEDEIRLKQHFSFMKDAFTVGVGDGTILKGIWFPPHRISNIIYEVVDL